jgi:signal transduction histidine kinase
VINATFLLSCFISLAISIIGLFVLTKNTKSISNRSFFYFSLSLGLWIISNYLSNSSELSLQSIKVANHLTLFFSGAAVVSIFRFTSQITDFMKPSRLRLVSSILFVGPLLSLTPLVVQEVTKQEAVYAIKFGLLSPLYFLSIFAGFLGVLVILITGVKRRTGAEKQRLVLILTSTGLTILIALIANAVLPIITGSFSSTVFGPFSVIIMVIGISYSIIKHQLFDIRLLLARSVGYILALGVLGLTYGLVAFIIMNRLLFRNSEVPLIQEITYTVMAVGLTFTFQPVKRFFDKASNTIFFKDAYEPQALLDQLSSELVGVIHIDKLLQHTSKIIESNLKVVFTGFVLKTGKENEYRRFALSGKVENVEEIVNLLEEQTITEIAREDIDQDLKLSKLMRSQGVGVIIKLATHGNDVGYIVIGEKKSGNLFTKQDMRILNIISDELSLAILSALQFEEIESFNITLQKKVEDATGQLRHTNEKLKALDETKDEFISMASHQLRTPLTSVKGYLSMVLEGDAGELNEQQKKLLNQAFTSSQRMVYLIADLLNVSRLRTGKFIIEAKPTSLADVIEGEISQLQETAQARGLKVTYDKPQNFPLLNLDETKIRQVIMNFIDNAIYYTPAGGTIDVQLEATDQTVEYRVVDTGLGVPKAEQRHLFTKFYRADNAKRARPDGTGLGLFMAKKVIVAQGGAIIFKSQEDKGSTFGFSFPRHELETKKNNQ